MFRLFRKFHDHRPSKLDHNQVRQVLFYCFPTVKVQSRYSGPPNLGGVINFAFFSQLVCNLEKIA